MRRLKHGRQRAFGRDQQARRVELAVRLEELVRANSRWRGASGAGNRARSDRGCVSRKASSSRSSRPRGSSAAAWAASVLGRHLAQIDNAAVGQRGPHADARCRRSCRRGSSARRSSCCRSRRRWWRGCWTRDRARTSARSALSWLLRLSRLSPGSTVTVRSSTLRSRMRERYLEKSITSAAPTVCPASDEPPPRGRIGTP